MQYQVIVVPAARRLATRFDKAAEELAERVEVLMAQGWQPQGGIVVGATQGSGEPHLLQAMVKR